MIPKSLRKQSQTMFDISSRVDMPTNLLERNKILSKIINKNMINAIERNLTI